MGDNRTFQDLGERVLRMSTPEPNTGCWLWIGNLNGGYGKMRIGGMNGANRYAHRISYEAFVGPIPEGHDLDHLCRTRCCVNPKHLEPVTRTVNARRGLTGAHNKRKTHCPYGHPFDEANTLLQTTKAGTKRRHCRECMRQYARHRKVTH